MTRLRCALLAVVALAAGFGGPVVARQPERGWPAQDRPERRGLDSDQAAARAQQATGGRVLGVRGGDPVYRVKVLLPGGRVREVVVDPRSGDVAD